MLSDRVFQSILGGFYFWYLDQTFYSQIIAYLFSCKELCQDSRANIIGTFIYFNHRLL